MQRLTEPPSQGVASHERRKGVGRAPSAVRSLPRSRARIPRADRLLACQGEDRFVTLLFSDMCRSLETTRDLPPKAAAAFVNRLLVVMVDVILTYEGCIDRFQGDGALAVFGMPHVQ